MPAVYLYYTKIKERLAMKENFLKDKPMYPERKTIPVEFDRERKEISAIAEMLTDGENIYCLLGAAQAMLLYEAETHRYTNVT